MKAVGDPPATRQRPARDLPATRQQPASDSSSQIKSAIFFFALRANAQFCCSHFWRLASNPPAIQVAKSANFFFALRAKCSVLSFALLKTHQQPASDPSSEISQFYLRALREMFSFVICTFGHRVLIKSPVAHSPSPLTLISKCWVLCSCYCCCCCLMLFLLSMF